MTQVVLILVHVHPLMTTVHKGHDTLIGLSHTLGHLIGLTGKIHLDMMTMMTETPTIGLVIMIDNTRTDMTAQNTTMTGLAGQEAILHSIVIDATMAMTTILHHIDSGKVKAKARVTTIHMVTIKILITNEITETRTVVIARLIMVIRNTTIINQIISQTMGIGRITK